MDNNKDKTQEFENAVDKLSETMEKAIEQSQEKVFNFYADDVVKTQKLIEERDKNDDGTRYTSDDVIKMRQDIKQFVQDNIYGTNNHKNHADIMSNILAKYRTLENTVKDKEVDIEKSELERTGLVKALLAKQVVNNAYKEAFKEEENSDIVERKGDNDMRNILAKKMLGKRIDDVYFDTNQIHIGLEDNTVITLEARVNVDKWPVLNASVSYNHTEEGNI